MMMSRLWYSIFIFIFVSINNLVALELRKLTPPLLGDDNVSKLIHCYRPAREGMPRMCVREDNGKTIIDNYGHGSRGWSVGPGCADHVVNLLHSADSAFKSDTPCTVVGAGVAGLLTVYHLLQRGHDGNRIKIVAQKFDNLTSHKAGGLFAPGSSNDTTDDIKAVMAPIGVKSCAFYRRIAQRDPALAEFERGVQVMPGYFASREDSDLEVCVAGGVMQPAKDVVVDFGNKKHTMVVYDDALFMHTHRLMRSLLLYALRDGVTCEDRSVDSFAALNDTYIFNCAGLGARELAHDTAMSPIQGHLIMLKDQNPASLNYMLEVFLGSRHNERGQRVGELVYLFPKQELCAPSNVVGVLGGTFIRGATDATPNDEEFENMLKRAREFFGIAK